MKRIVYLMPALLLLCAAAPVAPVATTEAPLEITADQTLEWHRNEQQYIARGNAVAKQGDVTIAADTLTAFYKETQNSAFDIYRLTASGNVVISSQGSAATGSEAVYDVATGLATITGGNLKITSPDQTVTARDKFEYFVTEGRLSAVGDAVVARGGDSLQAEKVSAWFAEDKTGSRQISRMTAEGGVTITTPNETLTGARAEYQAATDMAEVTGDVRITRGPNVLEGEKADVNLATNVSRIFGGPAGDGRVRGVFYPGSEKPPQEQAAPQGSLIFPGTQGSMAP